MRRLYWRDRERHTIDLLERVHRALPEVERWIDALHAQHAWQSRPAIESGFPRLVACLPADLLAQTRFVVVGRIPFPPVVEYGLPEFQAMAEMPMAGITFRDMYFVSARCASERIHFHELVHAVQWKTLGARPFLLTYALGIIQQGYEASPLEAIAARHEARFARGLATASVPEEIARHAVQSRHDALAVFRANGIDVGV